MGFPAETPVIGPRPDDGRAPGGEAPIGGEASVLPACTQTCVSL